jgi:hypothetical protein
MLYLLNIGCFNDWLPMEWRIIGMRFFELHNLKGNIIHKLDTINRIRKIKPNRMTRSSYSLGEVTERNFTGPPTDSTNEPATRDDILPEYPQPMPHYQLELTR